MTHTAPSACESGLPTRFAAARSEGPTSQLVLVVLLDNGTIRHHTCRDDLGRSESARCPGRAYKTHLIRQRSVVQVHLGPPYLSLVRGSFPTGGLLILLLGRQRKTAVRDG